MQREREIGGSANLIKLDYEANMSGVNNVSIEAGLLDEAVEYLLNWCGLLAGGETQPNSIALRKEQILFLNKAIKGLLLLKLRREEP